MNTECFQGKYCETLKEVREGPVGSFCYRYFEGQEGQYPNGVKAIHIKMRGDNHSELGCEHVVHWTSSHYLNGPRDHANNQYRWDFSGTKEQPTMHPSLNWVDNWHGWMKAGKLESC